MVAGLALLALWVLGSRLGWFSPAEVEDPNSPVRKLTAANWNAEVLDTDKPVLVDFWATWCGPCRAQGPIVAQVARDLSTTAVVGKVDVDQQNELAGRFGVASIPTLLVIRKGQVIQTFVGVTRAEDLKKALAQAGA